MAKNITLDDCKKLREDFVNYCNEQEPHTFPLLAMINFRMDDTIKVLEHTNGEVPQSELRSMFRVVLGVMHRDSSEYQEAESGAEI